VEVKYTVLIADLFNVKEPAARADIGVTKVFDAINDGCADGERDAVIV